MQSMLRMPQPGKHIARKHKYVHTRARAHTHTHTHTHTHIESTTPRPSENTKPNVPVVLGVLGVVAAGCAHVPSGDVTSYESRASVNS